MTKERRKGKEEVEVWETVCPKCGKVYEERICGTCECTSVKHEPKNDKSV